MKDVSSRKSSYATICQAIRQEIEQSVLLPGHRVPSESDIIRRFVVSSTTARRALNELETQNFIERRQGRGSFVREFIPESGWKRVGLLRCENPSEMPFSEPLIHMLEAPLYTRRRRLVLLCVGTISNEEQVKLKKAIAQEKLSSLLLYGHVTEEIRDFASRLGVPTIVFGNNGLPLDVPQVMFDAVAAGRMAAEVLLQHGYRQIGFLNGARWYQIARSLYEGFREALDKKGFPFRDDLVYWTEGRHAHQEALDLLARFDLEKRTAVFCEGGTIPDMLQALRERGQCVPADIGVLVQSTETTPISSGGPALTSIMLSGRALAEQTAAAIEKIDSGAALTPHDKLVPPQFGRGETLLLS